jgi:predicted aconitase
MDRREFIRVSSSMALGVVALTPGTLLLRSENAIAAIASAASGTGVPDWAGRMISSDMLGLGEGGKRDPNYNANGTGSSRTEFKYDPSKPPHQMTLTKEEQDIMDGKEGEVLAKVMKTVVAHGNAFGADKLVDLGGSTHCSFFNGPPYIQGLLDVFTECADAGLKTVKPYTVNPRPFDLYNVETQPDEMAMVFEGYSLQTELDYLHVRLGAEGMNTRSCACYLPEIGNKPAPGTYVAWAESSAVNYGNSVLGLRTNRNATGMELLCALLGKAPYFGLMTEEGRMAKWLIDVKTTKEPDWGVLGGAIGMKCSEDVPYIVGIDKYLGGKVDDTNMHKLKAMGSSTASNGAVGLYHVEKITPDAVEKGRDLLVEGYQTYVIDDAELDKIYSSYPNLWSKIDAKPNRCFIGCPHNSYQEILTWGKNVTEALKKRGQKKVAVPIHLFCATVVRDHLIDEHPELVRDMKRGGMTFSNMCAVMFTGLAGYQETEFAVTNSNKTRKYSSSRYFPDEVLQEIVLTGEMPKEA